MKENWKFCYSVTLATFQVLNRGTCLARVTLLDGATVEHFHYTENSIRQLWFIMQVCYQYHCWLCLFGNVCNLISWLLVWQKYYSLWVIKLNSWNVPGKITCIRMQFSWIMRKQVSYTLRKSTSRFQQKQGNMEMLIGTYAQSWLLQQFQYFILFQVIAGLFWSSSLWYIFKEQNFFNLMVLKNKYS